MSKPQHILPRRLVDLFDEWCPGDGDERPEVEAVFSSGHSNRSFLIRHAGRRYVARFPEKAAAQLGVDRQVERRVLDRAAHIALGPEVVYCNPARGTLVTAYIEGRPLRIEGLGAGDTIDRLAVALQLLHRQKLDVPSVNIADRIRSYARELHTAEARGWLRARRWLAAARHVLEQYRFGNYRDALCHHDLTAQNVLEADGELRFIDWEYAARGDPFVDLATLAEECNFSALDRERMLLAYGTIGDAAIERLFRARVLYRLLGLLWYLRRYRGASARTQPALGRHESALATLLAQGPGS